MPSADTALAAADRLRRVRDALAAGAAPDADDAVWLGSALDRYLNAPAQLDLGRALGLSTPPGGSPWWRASADAQRDALIRELGATLTLTGTAHARAGILQQMLRRYAASSWPRDRVSGSPTAANAVLYRIYSLDPNPPTGTRRLTEILNG